MRMLERQAGHRGRPVRPALRAVTVVTAAAAMSAMAAAVPAAAATVPAAGAALARAGHRAAATSPVISTVAGGVGRATRAASVAMPNPCGLAVAQGHLYITDSGTVRNVNGSGQLTTPVGTGVFGPPGDGHPATSASVGGCGVAKDHAGNLVIADGEHSAVRVVAAQNGTMYGQAMTAGDIYTVAGNGKPGFSGDGGPATAAKLNSPGAVRVDAAGNLVIADGGNNRIRVVAERTGTMYGRPMTAGDIYTVAGGFAFSSPTGLAVDPAGNLVVANKNANEIQVVAERTGEFYGRAMTTGNTYRIVGKFFGFFGDGGPALRARLGLPGDVTLDHAGNLVIADSDNSRIRVVAESTGEFYGQAMTGGDIYTVAGAHRGFSGDGGPATAARLNNPSAVKVDGSGNLVVADTGNNRVRVVAESTATFYGQAMTAGDIYTVAGNGTPGYSGDGRPALSAQIFDPSAVAVAPAVNVIADTDNSRIRVVATKTGRFYGQQLTATDIYTVAGTGTQGYSGDGGPGTKAEVSRPFGVAVDGSGNVLIADTFNNRVRVVAQNAGTFYGKAMTGGGIYTVAGNGQRGFSGDGGPATAAELNGPSSMTPDASGNLVISDTFNNRIRVLAERTGEFYGQAMTTGDIYTIAGTGTQGYSGDGGPATAAELGEPGAVTFDQAGNVVIGDTFNNAIRVVAERTGEFDGQAMTAGDIYTVAGTGTQGYSGDGGPALAAELNMPSDVKVDGSGNLVIADQFNNRIRAVAATTGTFYGQAMTAGDIYTVAGDGQAGFSGDGGPATGAGLNDPSGIAFDGAGGLLIADTDNQRIREFSG